MPPRGCASRAAARPASPSWRSSPSAAAIVAADPAERFREFKQPPAEPAAPGAAAASDDVNSSGRWQFWDRGRRCFRERARGRHRRRRFEDWWARNATIAVFVRNPHSLPLQEVAELGVVGVALLLGFGRGRRPRRLPASLGRPRRRRRRPVAVLGRGGSRAAIDWTWEIPAVFAPAVVAAGLLTASAPGPEADRKRVLARPGNARGRLGRDDRGGPGGTDGAEARAEPRRRRARAGSTRGSSGRSRRGRCSLGRRSPTPSSRCSRRRAATSTRRWRA